LNSIVSSLDLFLTRNISIDPGVSVNTVNTKMAMTEEKMLKVSLKLNLVRFLKLEKHKSR